MNILPPSQINNLPILEEVLEELRLSVLDNIFLISETLNLYDLTSEDLKKKLNLLGLVSISIGKFIKISLSDKEFEYISPSFYKGYRKLNRHRGNKMSMDYILHSAGMMNTLVHSNQNFYSGDVFSNEANFFEFNTFRDNQITDLNVGDGYIIVPYTSNRSQILKQYLATNPIIFSFLPAGYTFIFLSEYRNGYNNGVHQYDNFLNLFCDSTDIKEVDGINQDIHNLVGRYYWEDFDLGIVDYIKPRYWEDFSVWPDVEEVIILPDGTEFTVNRTLYYYDPFLFRDKGIRANVIDYPRYTYDPSYDIPLFVDFPINRDIWPEWPDWSDETKYPSAYFNENLQRYLDAYNKFIIQKSINKWEQGLESDLNNTLIYRDIWLGDYLLSTYKGANVYSEFYDHVKGLIAPQNASYSPFSLYQRGETIASQYFQREDKIVSTLDNDLQGTGMDTLYQGEQSLEVPYSDQDKQRYKKEIITDRKEVDLFKFSFTSDLSIELIAFFDEQIVRDILSSVFGYSTFIIDNILDKFRDNGKATIINGIEPDSHLADSYYSAVINKMRELENEFCNDVIINILSGNTRVIRTNNTLYQDPSVIDTLNPNITSNVHVDITDNNTNILNQNMQKVVLSVSLVDKTPMGTETLYQGDTPIDLPYIDE